METYVIRDRAAMQVEIARLRRIEAKADSGIREAIVRQIRKLQLKIENISPDSRGQKNAA